MAEYSKFSFGCMARAGATPSWMTTLMSHLLTGTKFSDFAIFVFGLGAVVEVVTSVFIL